MRIAIVHGYFLSDSGSSIYVRELSRELVRQGHDITLVCQESRPEKYDFIDTYYRLNRDNTRLEKVFTRPRAYGGSCRMIRPHLGGKLLTYVEGDFTPFESTTFQRAPRAAIEQYVEANTKALEIAFKRWPQDFIQTNHVLMQPYVVKEALAEPTPYCVTVHGSALNFTAKRDPRMLPFFLEGPGGAVSVVCLSDKSAGDACDFAATHRLELSSKIAVIPPGVDIDLFVPAKDRREVLTSVSESIDAAHDDVAVFAGPLLWTKGLQYALAALPLILAQRPRLHLIVCGKGPAREPLGELISALESGRLVDARKLTEHNEHVHGVADFGPVIPDLAPADEARYVSAARGLASRIHFTGHLDHGRLAPIMGASDVSVTPSVFDEAFALVSIEALAAGALPLTTYQSGLRAPLDVVSREITDPALKSLAPGKPLTPALADLVVRSLGGYPTKSRGHRRRLHDIAVRYFSWRKVAEQYLVLIQ